MIVMYMEVGAIAGYEVSFNGFIGRVEDNGFISRGNPLDMNKIIVYRAWINLNIFMCTFILFHEM